MIEGETEVSACPPGNTDRTGQSRRIRFGGVLTKTGLGTLVEEGKQTVEVDGEKFLLEKPMRANVALLFAEKADMKGNLSFHGVTRNFNSYMGAAADISIVEAWKVVGLGEMCPDEVVVPGVFVNYIVDGGVL